MNDEFDVQLDSLLDNLARLIPEQIAFIPRSELEFILSDFVISGGRRLRLDMEQWPTPEEQEALRRFSNSWWPFFVAPDFPNVTEDQIRTLALATTCFHLYTALVDQIVDKANTCSAELILALSPILEHWFQLSAVLFDRHSSYWIYARQIQARLSRAMRDERLRQPTTTLTLEAYLESCRGRVAFTCVNAIGLATLEGQIEHIPHLCDFWTRVSLSAVIHDDICDWMEDYCDKRYSYLHLQLLASPPFRAEVLAGTLPDITELGIALFLSDLAETLYGVADTEAQRAYSDIIGYGYQRHREIGRRALDRVESRRMALMERKMRLFLTIDL